MTNTHNTVGERRPRLRLTRTPTSSSRTRVGTISMGTWHDMPPEPSPAWTKYPQARLSFRLSPQHHPQE